MTSYASFLLVILYFVGFSSSWIPTGTLHRFQGGSLLLEAARDDDEEPDLFEYFDPLLSPHAYPDGVSPKNKPVSPTANHRREKTAKFGFDYLSQKQASEEDQRSKEEVNTGDSEDLFSYFDPLLSPHAYPNGVRPDSPPKPLQVESWTGQDPNDKRKKSSRGGKSSVKVGILLMDHGSRNEASNMRLKHLAELYQMKMNDDNESEIDVVVEACHMEIAKPSIPDGLEKLLAAGVGT